MIALQEVLDAAAEEARRAHASGEAAVLHMVRQWVLRAIAAEQDRAALVRRVGDIAGSSRSHL